MAARGATLLEPRPRTVDEFLRWERELDGRYELIDGEVVDVSPERTRHAKLKSEIARLLGNALDGRGYAVMVDGPQVRFPDLVAVPDVVVAAEPVDEEAVLVETPVLLVEIPSPGRERHDTEVKWRRYAGLASLRHYLIVSQDERLVVAHSRIDAGPWHVDRIASGIIPLTALGCSLGLEAVYATTRL